MKLKVLKALLFILFTTMGYTNLLAQPSLGDIVITGYNSDGDPSNPDVDDEFVVTLLADMVGSTIISFTDNGWFASGGFRAGEGTITLSMANAYSCGSEIRFVKDGNGLWSALDETGTPTGSITQTGDLALSSSGDQIMVYSGSIAPTASDESAFITALHFGGATWDADATGSVESAQPSIFINNPGNDFAVAHQDNGKFNCSGIGSTTNAFPPDLRANIYDASHWDFTNSSTSRFDLSQFCNFSCEPCLDPIISSISTNRLNNSFCLGDLIVISIDGSANDAATWGLYTGSCGDNLVNSIPGDSTTFELTASTSTTYFIRGEGGCIGNNGNCTSIEVVVGDTEAPLLTCPANINTVNDPDLCSAIVNFNVSATDNCDPDIAITYSQSSGTPFLVGATIVSVTATDDFGNSRNCSFEIIVADAEAPAFSNCPTNIAIPNDPGSCGAIVNWTAPDLTDNCSAPTISASHLPGDFFPVGTTTVSYTGIDEAANQAMDCTFSVTVDDSEAPAFSNCPTNITISNDPGSCGAIVNWIAPDLTDNCSAPTISASHFPGDFFPVGTTTVSYTGIDEAANQATDCTFNVTVDDSEAPLFSNCPTNITISNDPGSCGAIVNWTAPDLTDNCSAPTISASHLPGDFFPVGTTTVSYTGIDEAANQAQDCTFSVTVDDSEVPLFSNCPTNITISNDLGSCGAIVNWTAPDLTDNCSAPTISASHLPGDFFPVGTTTVSYTGIDEAANQAQDCTFSVTVDDSEAPLFSNCPTNFTISNDLGSCGAIVNWTAPDLTDNCSAPTISASHLPGDFFPVGTTTVSYTGIDEAANQATDCTFSITVDDSEVPIAICRNLTIQLDATGNASITVDEVNNGSNGACGAVVLTLDDYEFDCNDIGSTAVTLLATDSGGNTASCTAIIEVEDNIQPMITACPSSLNACGSQAIDWTPPVASDNCTVSISSNFTPSAIFPEGTTTVLYTATDDGGNTASCSFDITIYPVPAISIVQETLPNLCQGIAQLSAEVSNVSSLITPLTYAWSGGLGNESTALVLENGSYELSVTDSRGCTAVTMTTLNVDIDRSLSGYVLLSKKNEIELKRSTVNGGGIGMLNQDGKVKLDDQTVVNTFVKAKQIEVTGGSDLANSIQQTAGVTLPPFLGHNRSGGNDITVSENSSVTLSGDLYKKIIVEKNATLIFDNPEVFIEEMETKEGAIVDFAQDAVLRIKKDLKIDKENSFNPVSRAVVVYLKEKLEVKENSDFKATVYTEDKIETKGESANKPTNMTGLFIAIEEIKSDKWTNWNWSNNCNLNLGGNNQPFIAINGANGRDSNEELMPLDFKVFPNPASDHLNLDLGQFNDQPIAIQVFHVNGQLIHNQRFSNFSASNLQLNTNAWADGTYFIRVIVNDKFPYMKKVLIQHP